MTLPGRSFYNIHEASARWGCSTIDIANWAAAGILDLVTSVTHCICGRRSVAGIVAIPVADILPFFRRLIPKSSHFVVRRLRPLEQEGGEWLFIEEPGRGIELTIEDLYITAEQAHEFEREHGVFLAPRASAGAGQSRHDWEAMYARLCQRIYEHGLPESQNELVREMHEFFIRRSVGNDAPDESTIRKRVKPIWHAIIQTG